MTGGSVEETLELWASSLRDVKGRIRPLFLQERMAASAGLFLDALLGPERRKTGWMRAEAAGDPGPWRQQALLGRAAWDADALRDVVRDYAVETLAEPDAVLVVDETGFLKQGKASCGVGRQYTGSAGKITNCQIGVFAAYVSGKGHAFIDRALYLPKAWTDDPARRAAAHVPRGRHLRHQAPARASDDRASHRGGRALRLGGGRQHLRGGRDRDDAAPSRQGLRARRQRHASVQLLDRQARGRRHGRGDRRRSSTVAPGSASRPGRAPRASGSTTGPIANSPTSRPTSTTTTCTGLWTRGLLIRRSLTDGELAFFSTWCPAGTAIATLVSVEGRRWAIEDAFETAKTELGLAHNETRSWHGWHRHVSLVMLAFAMMAAVRHRANHLPPPKRARRARQAARLIRWSVQEIRRIAMRLAQRRIRPAHVIAWSLWRRAHQAAAREAHIKRKPQL